MVLRRAVPRDAETLVELRLEFMRIVKDSGLPDEAEWRRDLLRFFSRGLSSGRLRAFLAVDGGEVVASAALRLDRRRRKAGSGPVMDGYVMSVYTRPRWRRRGLARGLMAAVLEDARGLGLGRLVLHPTEDARGLYSSMGFRPFRTVMLLDLDAGANGAMQGAKTASLDRQVVRNREDLHGLRT